MENVEYQIAEMAHFLANYQAELKILQVKILQLELKKEKLMDRVILQSLKAKIATSSKDTPV